MSHEIKYILLTCGFLCQYRVACMVGCGKNMLHACSCLSGPNSLWPKLFFACNRLACKRQKNLLFFCASKACLQMAMLLVACLVMMAQATWGPPVWYQGQYWQQWQEDGSWHPVDGWNRRGRDDPPPGGNWDQQWGQQQSWQESSGWSAWPEEGHSNRWDRSYTSIGEPQKL